MADTTTPNERQVIDATIVRTHSPSSRPQLAWLAIALALLALGVCVALYLIATRTLNERAQESSAGIAELRDAQQALDSRVENFSGTDEAVAQLRQDLERRTTEQAATAEELKQSLGALAQTQNVTEDRWVLHEVHYLLTVAEQRLRLERDVATALAALEAADRRLSLTNDPTLIPIRERLIADLNALRAVQPIDTTGMTLTLADLLERADTLPLKGTKEEPAEAEGTDAAAPVTLSGDGWRGAVHRIWKDLIELIDIKSMDVPDDIVFDPGRRYLLQQNLKLELAAARLEVLRHDTANLRASLARINTLLQRYYDTDTPEVAGVRDTLAPMAEVELAPPLPVMDETLALVRARMDAASATEANP